ncbi:hypothetical protein QAD02_003072 [Eretmocerus hayati]|uniref:Uncharacterized protein n=1 Tax=Eretmocerus hayati TaxID=131215 RepID=A0ACC2NKU6_9HYME|nr:hypothetical protein QAD02_003072 [Eretmocerus hayati]
MECRNFIEDPTIRRTSAVLHDAHLYRFPSATVLWIAPRDDDRPGRDHALDWTSYNRTERTSAVLHDAYLYRFSSATVLWIAPRDDDRPDRDESAELDLVQQNRTVEDQNAVNSRIVLTSAVLHDAYLYRFSSATVLWIAPRDDDRPERDESAELDLRQQGRTVEDQNAVNSRIVF